MYTRVELLVDHELNDDEFSRMIKSFVINLYAKCKSVKVNINEPEEDDTDRRSRE